MANKGIYGILPADLATEQLLEQAKAAMLGGVRVLQFRDKKPGFKHKLKRAVLLRDLTLSHDTTLIINDSLQLARDCGADGVHLGRDDVADISKVRREVSPEFILGITCRADARYAKTALDFGADYVAFGAVFPSLTKPDVPPIGLPRLHKACQMFPEYDVCAIGGITLESLPSIKAAGASYAAVISSLFHGDPAQIQQQARQMVELWHNAPSA